MAEDHPDDRQPPEEDAHSDEPGSLSGEPQNDAPRDISPAPDGPHGEDPQDVQRTRFLLTNLVIITLFIITLVFVIAAYPALLSPDATPTASLFPTQGPTLTPSFSFPTRLPTLTPAPSFTPRHTLTPSVTPTPTETGTPTPTGIPQGPPTLTPARPLANREVYRLKTWTPDDAGLLIDMLNTYPFLLPENARGEDDAAFYQAFAYAAYAQREALLRFPDAPQAASWRWSLAYNLAASGDPNAGQSYTDLILQALNQGDTNLRDLSLWFNAREPRLELDLIPLAPLSGYLSSHLAQVRGPGSAFIWLLETSGGFQATTLASRFDFVRQPQAASVIADLTGDGREDVAIYFSRPQEDFRLEPPIVFDLGQTPPAELPFQPAGADFNLGVDFENFWAVEPVEPPDAGLPAESPENALLFSTTVFPACPVTVERAYTWDGISFVPGEARFSVEPNAGTLSYCRFIVDHAAQVWGAKAASGLMETLLPGWPPEQDENGEAFALDAKDEWRYRLGVLYALQGDALQARRTLSGLVDEPNTPLSRWVEPAQAFLDRYRDPLDIYPACVAAQFCNPAEAVRFLVESAALQDSGQLVQFLSEHGVTLRANGFFDFDLDREKERWFTVRHHPAEKLEFWILAPGADRVYALQVGSVVSDVPQLDYFDEAQQPVEVRLDDVTAFYLLRDPVTRQPYLETFAIGYEWRNPFLEGLQAAREALLSGVDPKQVERDLLDLQEFPGLMCKPYWTCDPYYYTLGLASELAGDKTTARDAYLQVWWDYSKSPFTTMARMKLAGGGVQPSATPTPTPTGMLLVTATPTLTPGPGTPGVTPATLTPSPTSEDGDAYP